MTMVTGVLSPAVTAVSGEAASVERVWQNAANVLRAARSFSIPVGTSNQDPGAVSIVSATKSMCQLLTDLEAAWHAVSNSPLSDHLGSLAAIREEIGEPSTSIKREIRRVAAMVTDFAPAEGSVYRIAAEILDRCGNKDEARQMYLNGIPTCNSIDFFKSYVKFVGKEGLLLPLLDALTMAIERVGPHIDSLPLWQALLSLRIKLHNGVKQTMTPTTSGAEGSPAGVQPQPPPFLLDPFAGCQGDPPYSPSQDSTTAPLFSDEQMTRLVDDALAVLATARKSSRAALGGSDKLPSYSSTAPLTGPGAVLESACSSGTATALLSDSAVDTLVSTQDDEAVSAPAGLDPADSAASSAGPSKSGDPSSSAAESVTRTDPSESASGVRVSKLAQGPATDSTQATTVSTGTLDGAPPRAPSTSLPADLTCLELSQESGPPVEQPHNDSAGRRNSNGTVMVPIERTTIAVAIEHSSPDLPRATTALPSVLSPASEGVQLHETEIRGLAERLNVEQGFERIRSVYRNWLANPTEQLAQVWRGYRQFEGVVHRSRFGMQTSGLGRRQTGPSALISGTKTLVSRLLSSAEATFNAAQKMYEQLNAPGLYGRLRGILPSTDSARLRRRRERAWYKVMSLELDNPIGLSQHMFECRLVGVFELALGDLNYAPGLWATYIKFLLGIHQQARAISRLRYAIDHLLPNNEPLQFLLVGLLESCGAIDQAIGLLRGLVVAACPNTSRERFATALRRGLEHPLRRTSLMDLHNRLELQESGSSNKVNSYDNRETLPVATTKRLKTTQLGIPSLEEPDSTGEKVNQQGTAAERLRGTNKQVSSAEESEMANGGEVRFDGTDGDDRDDLVVDEAQAGEEEGVERINPVLFEVGTTLTIDEETAITSGVKQSQNGKLPIARSTPSLKRRREVNDAKSSLAASSLEVKNTVHQHHYPRFFYLLNLLRRTRGVWETGTVFEAMAEHCSFPKLFIYYASLLWLTERSASKATSILNYGLRIYVEDADFLLGVGRMLLSMGFLSECRAHLLESTSRIFDKTKRPPLRLWHELFWLERSFGNSAAGLVELETQLEAQLLHLDMSQRLLDGSSTLLNALFGSSTLIEADRDRGASNWSTLTAPLSLGSISRTWRDVNHVSSNSPEFHLQSRFNSMALYGQTSELTQFTISAALKSGGGALSGPIGARSTGDGSTGSKLRSHARACTSAQALRRRLEARGLGMTFPGFAFPWKHYDDTDDTLTPAEAITAAGSQTSDMTPECDAALFFRGWLFDSVVRRRARRVVRAPKRHQHHGANLVSAETPRPRIIDGAALRVTTDSLDSDFFLDSDESSTSSDSEAPRSTARPSNSTPPTGTTATSVSLGVTVPSVNGDAELRSLAARPAVRVSKCLRNPRLTRWHLHSLASRDTREDATVLTKPDLSKYTAFFPLFAPPMPESSDSLARMSSVATRPWQAPPLVPCDGLLSLGRSEPAAADLSTNAGAPSLVSLVAGVQAAVIPRAVQDLMAILPKAKLDFASFSGGPDDTPLFDPVSYVLNSIARQVIPPVSIQDYKPITRLPTTLFAEGRLIGDQSC